MADLFAPAIGQGNGLFLAMIAERKPITELRAFAKSRADLHKPSLKKWLKMGGYDL